MNFFRKRKTKKLAHDILRQARHLRNMREDVLSAKDLKKLEDAEKPARDALRAGDMEAVEKTGQSLYKCITELIPTRSFPAVRENFEIIVVAIAAAMAIRTYFLQPFKIPTGSMQPTLNGIIYRPQSEVGGPTMFDRMPLKVVKWFATGVWYMEIKAWDTGILTKVGRYVSPTDAAYYIGARKKKLPRKIELTARNGAYVEKGDILWAGARTAGDHVFVDKVRWNFVKPRRGNIIVFATDNIPIDVPRGTHYIKRLVGLPGETIAIDPPSLLVDGKPVRDPRAAARKAYPEAQYPEYQWGGKMLSAANAVSLSEHEYFALGDNARSSKDGRYWGSVPEPDVVGPALFIYWPFGRHWGFAK